MDENVAKAVSKFDEYMDWVAGEYPDDDNWQTIRDRLVALEAEVEGMRTLLDLLRTGRDGKRYACIQSRSGSMVSVEDYLAHLSENSRG